jgi:hypothetical protein
VTPSPASRNVPSSAIASSTRPLRRVLSVPSTAFGIDATSTSLASISVAHA